MAPRTAQLSENIFKAWFVDDHPVDVSIEFLSGCNRAIDERQRESAKGASAERSLGIVPTVFCYQRVQFGKNWMAAIGAMKNLFAIVERSTRPSRLRRSNSRSNAQATEFASELAVVKGLVGTLVPEPKNGSAAIPEEHICQAFRFCSHYASNGTHIESGVKLVGTETQHQGDYAIRRYADRRKHPPAMFAIPRNTQSESGESRLRFTAKGVALRRP